MTEINLCMITDNNYVMPTAVAMTSAIQNKKEHNIYHFYVLVNDISPENAERLMQMRRSDVKIDLIEVDVSKYANINVKTHVPQSAAVKFDIPNIIKKDKVLYIDGDIIVCQDLEELYSTDLEDKLVAGVRDMVGELKQHFNQAVGCEKYFNSGVLLLNLKKLRKGNYTDLLIAAKKEHPQWRCMDQDAFNYVLSTKTKWLDVKYNNMMALYKHNEYALEAINDFYNVHYATEQDLEKDTVIIHLAGTPWQRPWKYKEGAFCALWDTYYAQSPFKDIVLERERFTRPVRTAQKTEEKVFKVSLFGFIPLLSIEDK